MIQNFIEELRWRGMLHDVMPDTENQLQKEMSVGYIGFDPTADSLHIGNMMPIMLLKRFQLAGHKPIALVGGATGMIGDPSGKSSERNILSEDVLQHNVACVRNQLEKFLDFDCGANSAELVNNYDWYKEFNILQFLREAGKYLTVSYMMAKDSVKNRLETGISFTEFSYQLFQGYDFYWLYKHKSCKLQMGGSDQWGNITTGTELIRRKDNGEAYALTCPLVTKTDGTKFGKSEQGNIWLDAEKTSPYKFYQFWLNVDDKDVSKLLRFFTLFEQAYIEQLEQQLNTDPNAVKRVLAEDMTKRVHSEDELTNAQKASALLFGKSALEDFELTDEKTLQEVFDGVPSKTFKLNEIIQFANWIDLLNETQLVGNSKGEIRKLIQGNGLSVNLQKMTVDEANQKPDLQWLRDKYILLKKGKTYSLIMIEK